MGPVSMNSRLAATQPWRPECVLAALQIALVIGAAGALSRKTEFITTAIALGATAGAMHLVFGKALQCVPGLEWAGAIIIDRLVGTQRNWAEQPLRSFTEVMAWLYIIFTVQATGEHFLLSVLTGTIFGLPVAILGDLLGQTFYRVQKQLLRWAEADLGTKEAQYFKPGWVWLTYFGGVVLAHILAARDTRNALLLSVLTGCCLVSAGQLMIVWKPTRWAGVVMQDRIINTYQNWQRQPVRSGIELSASVGIICGTYSLLQHSFAAVVLGSAMGIGIILASEYIHLSTEPSPAKMVQIPVLTNLAFAADLTLLLLYLIFTSVTSVRQLALALGLSAAASAAMCLVGKLFFLIPLTRKAAHTIDARIVDTFCNWNERPVRSAYEVAVWQLGMLVAYLFTGTFWLSIHLGTALGAVNVLVSDKLCRVNHHDPSVVQEAKPVPVAPEPSAVQVVKDQRIVRCINSAAPQQIGVNGNWYDMSSFAKHHPGGDVILEFMGLDATVQFLAFHSPSVLKRFKPVGTYDMKQTAAGKQPAEMAFVDMVNRLESEGYFGPEVDYYKQKVAFCAFLFALSVWGTAVGFVLAPGAAMGLFFMQAGFLTHDLMHNQIFKKRQVDQRHGWFWGNICLGASSVWWKVEHFEHHAFTNTYVEGVGTADPQQHEAPLWAQDKALRSTTSPLLQRIQHFTFLPILFIAGRFGLVIASYTMQRGLKEHIGCVLHWCWMCVILKLVHGHHGWSGVVVFYLTAGLVQGILALQLCISHYDKPFIEKDEAKGEAGWLRRQVETTKDVDCPWWLDWFHGGLNLHRVHHLMPRLCRSRYREVNKQLDELLDAHGIESDVEPFSSAVWSTLTHMQNQAYTVSLIDLIYGA